MLFLQSLRLQVGAHVVFLGSLIGVGLTLTVVSLNFLSHYRLPYRKMLVLTGLLFGGVLVVMVGETVQEMEQAHWPRHNQVAPLRPAGLDERLVLVVQQPGEPDGAGDKKAAY